MSRPDGAKPSTTLVLDRISSSSTSSKSAMFFQNSITNTSLADSFHPSSQISPVSHTMILLSSFDKLNTSDPSTPEVREKDPGGEGTHI